MSRFRKKQQPLSNNKDLYEQLDAFLKSEDVISLYMDFHLKNKRQGKLKISFGMDSDPDKVIEFTSLLENIGIEKEDAAEGFHRVYEHKESYFYKDDGNNFFLNFEASEKLRRFISLPEFYAKGSIIEKKLACLASNLNWNIANNKIGLSYSEGYLTFEHSGTFPLKDKISGKDGMGLVEVDVFKVKSQSEILYLMENSLLYSSNINDDGLFETKIISKKFTENLLKAGLCESSALLKFDGYEEFGKDYGKVFTSIILKSIPVPSQKEIDRYLGNV